MSEGTSLEDIETGNIVNKADSAVMNAILSDMNALPEEPAMKSYEDSSLQQPTYIPQPSIQIQELQTESYSSPFPSNPVPHHPMFDMYTPIVQDAPPSTYVAPVATNAVVHSKQSSWSDVFISVIDSLFVAVIVGILSLPVLHTRFSKHASWAYKVGGELSWTGIVTLSTMGGLVFIVLRWISTQSKIMDFVRSI